MIDTNSLRRGNWLNYTGESAGSYPIGHIQVSEILEDGVNLSQGDMIIYEAELLEGIPLTPEVLKPYGFYKEDGDKYDNSFIQLQYREDYGDFVFYYKGGATSVSTLHHLQNLYHALHAVELKPYLPANQTT